MRELFEACLDKRVACVCVCDVCVSCVPLFPQTLASLGGICLLRIQLRIDRAEITLLCCDTQNTRYIYRGALKCLQLVADVLLDHTRSSVGKHLVWLWGVAWCGACFGVSAVMWECSWASFSLNTADVIFSFCKTHLISGWKSEIYFQIFNKPDWQSAPRSASALCSVSVQ